MSTVEIRIFDETALADALTGMREWLDHRRYEPKTFRYTFNRFGMMCEIEFANENEGAEFARVFGGRVVGTAAAQATAK